MKKIPCRLIAAITVALISVNGCLVSPSSEQSASDTQDTALANETVGGMLLRMADIGTFQYGQEEVATVRVLNSLFKELLKLSPDNAQAKFVASVTGVIAAIESPPVASVLNQALSAPSPFDPLFASQLPRAQAVIVEQTAVMGTFPEFHQFQDALADSVLPALDFALANLPSVAADPAFSMEIPQSGQKKTVGSAEATLLLGGFKALRGLLTLFLAYDLDWDRQGSYDFVKDLRSVAQVRDWQLLSADEQIAVEHVRTLLDPSSPFLAVRDDWRTRLENADDDIAEALPVIKTGIAMVQSGTFQGPDPLIRTGESTSFSNQLILKRADLDMAATVIDSISTVLAGPRTVTLPLIGVSVRVDIRTLMGGIRNFRDLVPYYGLYASDKLSTANPLVYFTNANANTTGTLADVASIIRRGQTGEITIENAVDELRAVIHIRDPRYGGLFPDMTEQQLWSLVAMAATQVRTGSDPWGMLEELVLSLLSPKVGITLSALVLRG
jgi:hypothetical protein